MQIMVERIMGFHHVAAAKTGPQSNESRAALLQQEATQKNSMVNRRISNRRGYEAAAHDMSSDREVGPVRRLVAAILGAVAALCTLLWVLTFVFITLQAVTGAYDNPMLGMAVLILTFPPTLLGTIIALVLVGPGRCKLAWISLCIYVLPLALSFEAISAEALWHTIKPRF